MSEKSPLFISAMELLSHGVELLEQDNPKKNKFVVLHLCNAVELLLKDMVIDCGDSIYENNGKNTIGIWSAFKSLESHGIVIKQKPHIEMLVDDRNVIQHKFGYPSKESVLYYLQFVVELFRDCMNGRYDADFDDIAPEYFGDSGLVLIGASKGSEFSKVEAIAKYDLLSAVATAYSLLENRVHGMLGYDVSSKPVMIWHDPRFYKLLKEIDPKSIDGEQPKAMFDSIRQLRNVAVHRQHFDPEAMSQEMQQGITKIRKLDQALASIPDSKLTELRKQP